MLGRTSTRGSMLNDNGKVTGRKVRDGMNWPEFGGIDRRDTGVLDSQVKGIGTRRRG